MTLALLLAAALAAEPPLPATKQAAIAWYQAEGPRIDRVMDPLRAELWAFQLEPDAKRAEARRVALCDRAKGAAVEIAAIRPFDPDDRVRAAAIAEAEGLAATCAEDLKAWLALRAPIVADEDLAAAVEAAHEADLLAATRATDAATQAFGQAWGMAIRRPERARASFEEPGLVPEGSAAPARMVVQLALAYDRQLLPFVDGTEAAFREWASALDGWDLKVRERHEEARAKVARARQALDRVDPWLGDATLKDAARAHLDRLARALDDPGTVATALAARGLQQASEVEAQRPRVEALYASADEARAGWETAREAFAERWALKRYAAALPR